MKILVIGYVWPEPTSSAAGRRSLELLNTMREQGWSITWASPASKTDHSADLGVLGVQEMHIVLNHSSFDDMLRDFKPDVVIFDRFMMEEQFGWRVERHCPEAMRIIDTIDLHSLRLAREQAVKQGRLLTEVDFFSEHAKREVAAIWRSDLSFMISQPEVNLLVQRYGVPEKLLHYLPLMSHLDHLKPQAWSTFAERQHFVMIGNARHAPNWDAIRYLKARLWPEIRKALPEAEVHIYGAYMGAKVQQLHKPSEGFCVLGRATDAHQVIAGARVLLAPLRFGAGLKGKLLEAMEVGTPSVTSSVGAEGMQSSAGWSGIIADEPESFIRAAVRLYQDEALWQSCQQQGLVLVQELFDHRKHRQPLVNKLEELAHSLMTHRQTNFIGAMLRQEQLRSTEYMSRWIEVKKQLEQCQAS